MINPFIIDQSYSKRGLIDNSRSNLHKRLGKTQKHAKSCDLSNVDEIKEEGIIMGKNGTYSLGHFKKCYANKKDHEAGILSSLLIHLWSLDDELLKRIILIIYYINNIYQMNQ